VASSQALASWSVIVAQVQVRRRERKEKNNEMMREGNVVFFFLRFLSSLQALVAMDILA